MGGAGYEVTHIDQIPEPPGEKEEGEPDWHAVRIHFGIQSFGVNAYTATQDGEIVGEHDEIEHSGTKHEELYYVSTGSATCHGRRRDRRGARRNLRLRARPGVNPLGRGARGRDDHPLPGRYSRRGVPGLALGTEVRPGIGFVT